MASIAAAAAQWPSRAQADSPAPTGSELATARETGRNSVNDRANMVAAFLADVSSKTGLVDLVGQYSKHSEQTRRVRRTQALDPGSWGLRSDTVQASPTSTRRRLNAETIAEMASAYESGAAGRELAKHFGLARSTVIKILREHGVEIRHRRLTLQEQTQIINLSHEGHSQVEIARRIGRGPGLIWHLLRRAQR